MAAPDNDRTPAARLAALVTTAACIGVAVVVLVLSVLSSLL
ncbi:MAG TPA: hypothetical protein VFC13_03915 [Actinomycetes bacterium]|jgi:hypothetical protein|nr:hypothetical protein [Actinomycetes bacterium]